MVDFTSTLEFLRGIAIAASMHVQPCVLPEFTDEYEMLVDIAIEQNWEPRYHIYKCVAMAQIFAESSGNPKAVSESGAEGLAQVMPATFKWLAKNHHLTCSPFDPKCAIEAYAIYSMYLVRYFKAPRPDGDRIGGWMPTAYHAGQRNADKAQRLCRGANNFKDMEPCLQEVIGKLNAKRNAIYVRRIAAMYQRMTGRILLELQ